MPGLLFSKILCYYSLKYTSFIVYMELKYCCPVLRALCAASARLSCAAILYVLRSGPVRQRVKNHPRVRNKGKGPKKTPLFWSILSLYPLLTCLVMKLFERILKEELLLRTSHLLNSRQHGFLNLKSCSTNMISFSFTDNVVLSINDTRTL